MTEAAEAPVLGTPHPKVFYVVVLLFAAAAGVVFGYGALKAPTPSLAVVETANFLIFAAGLIIAAERLLRPRTAHERSMGLNPARREKLRSAYRIVNRLGWVCFFIGIVMHVSSSDTVAGLGTDLQISGGVMWFAAWCIADYCGDKLGTFSRRLV